MPVEEQPTTDGRVILDKPGWPTVFELNVGDTAHVRRSGTEREIRLLSVREHWQPDYWVEGNEDHRTLRMAEVTLDVSGAIETVRCRPCQMPTVVNGLRVYVEATRRWALEAAYANLNDMKADVRLSVVAEGEAWGPETFVFPIDAYRWRSSTYNNPWLALVPWNKLYYHRGEDYGAIPDRLPVVAGLGGKVVQSPLPDGDGRSNSVGIQTDDGITLRYAHMNLETIAPSLVQDAEVQSGSVLASTGMTWNGKRSQSHDPHLHFGMGANDTNISPYPYTVEAYLRTYDDPVIPVAGGFHYALTGESIELDATRSVARSGRSIREYEWRLHDGRTVRDPVVSLDCEQPGYFSEELVVRTDDGSEAHDFAHVRTYDPDRGRNIARGWLYHTPVRGVAAGTEVLFWNRLLNLDGAARVDFGDGSGCEEAGGEFTHTFAKPGTYTVTLQANGPAEEQVRVKTAVVVE